MTAHASHQPPSRLPRALACAAALLLLAPGLLASGAGYYRWVDDKGAPQFTQRPPTDRPSEFVRTATGTSSRVETGEATEQGAATGEADQQAGAQKPAGGTLEGLPEKDPAKCEQTRNTRSILDSSARIRERGADGEYRYLTPDEIAEQKRLADEAVKIYCD